jgi:hypothetical protein
LESISRPLHPHPLLRTRVCCLGTWRFEGHLSWRTLRGSNSNKPHGPHVLRKIHMGLLKGRLRCALEISLTSGSFRRNGWNSILQKFSGQQVSAIEATALRFADGACRNALTRLQRFPTVVVVALPWLALAKSTSWTRLPSWFAILCDLFQREQVLHQYQTPSSLVTWSAAHSA